MTALNECGWTVMSADIESVVVSEALSSVVYEYVAVVDTVVCVCVCVEIQLQYTTKFTCIL